jgi:hypothetical protein
MFFLLLCAVIGALCGNAPVGLAVGVVLLILAEAAR